LRKPFNAKIELMELIKYQKKETVAYITFNRPESLNAFNVPMFHEFDTILDKIETDDDIKIIVVAGAGRAFSAGVDLKTTAPSDFQKGAAFMELGKIIGDKIANSSKVTIAQVHGFCFTGALEMMLFFDLAYCATDTKFGDTHAKFSIIPQWGMSQRLARRVGLNKAKELTFRALRINGQEAERIGLVNQAFPLETLGEEVTKITNEIAQNSFEAIKVIKILYNQGFETTLKEGLILEQNADTALKNTGEQLNKFGSKASDF